MTERFTETVSLSEFHERCRIIKENYKIICENISEAAVKSGRKPEDVLFLAVTKTVPADLINFAISLGVTTIGENRVQEFLAKKPQLNLQNCDVHMIGTLQTNKVRQIVGEVRMIESVNSYRLGEEISKRSEQNGITTDVLIEVNIGDEGTKTGIDVAGTEELTEKLSDLRGIRVCGLMTIPPYCCGEAKTREYFYNMRKLFIDFSEKKHHNSNVIMKYLSMGMSDDYRIAIEEGSNIVRIGTALFGSRIINIGKEGAQCR